MPDAVASHRNPVHDALRSIERYAALSPPRTDFPGLPDEDAEDEKREGDVEAQALATAWRFRLGMYLAATVCILLVVVIVFVFLRSQRSDCPTAPAVMPTAATGNTSVALTLDAAECIRTAVSSDTVKHPMISPPTSTEGLHSDAAVRGCSVAPTTLEVCAE